MKYELFIHAIENKKSKVCNAFIILISLFFSINTFGQNIDWVNAPLNPIPQGADLKDRNLKGDVMQESITQYFTRDGKWFSYSGFEQLKKDAQGRITQYTDKLSGTTNYTYDSKGNLITSSGSTYEYDNKNRLVKVNHKYENSVYSYKNEGNLLIITELNTYNGKTHEFEHHYKNGLKILLKPKSGETLKYEYTFDAKGNWISMTTIDVATNKILQNKFSDKPLKPVFRDIIYYKEYDKGMTVLTVELIDLTEGRVANAPLIAISKINGKEVKKQLSARFLEDYIFYDPIANIYYIARNAFLKTNKVGQKIPVEKLISGKENILLFNGKNVRVVEKGNTEKDVNDWETTNYTELLGSYISVNQKNGGAYAFDNMPIVTDGKTVAISGKSINGIWYAPCKNKNDVRIFENGIYIDGKYSLAGYIVNTDIPVIAVEGKKEYYVLADYDNAVDKKFFKARFYDLKTDKAQPQKASLSNNSNTNPTQTTTKTTGSNTNTTDLYSGLSAEAKAYMATYKTNPNGLKNHLENHLKSWEQKGYSTDKVIQSYATMFKEIYAKDKDASYELLMRIPRRVDIKNIVPILSDEEKAFVRKKNKERIQNHLNSNSK